jgi:hypothetical protein
MEHEPTEDQLNAAIVALLDMGLITLASDDHGGVWYRVATEAEFKCQEIKRCGVC